MFMKDPKQAGAVSRCAKYKCRVRTMWLTHCTSIYATQDTAPACFFFPGYSTVIKNTARMVLVKSWKSWLLSVPFWLILFLS